MEIFSHPQINEGKAIPSELMEVIMGIVRELEPDCKQKLVAFADELINKEEGTRYELLSHMRPV